MNKTVVSLPVKFNLSSIEEVNECFTKVNIDVMAADKAANKFRFSKESILGALSGLKNLPLVGVFIEDKNTFGGHGGKIEIDADTGETKFTDTTVPYGTVPESSVDNCKFVEITEDDGTVSEYLNVDAIVWTHKYPGIIETLNNGLNQSMEIFIDEMTQNENGINNVSAFTFAALCLMGLDVSPAFPSAKVTAYSLKEEFKTEFSEMLRQISMFTKQAKFEKEDEFLNKGKTEKFSLSAEQLKDEIIRCLGEEKAKDDWGYEWRRYSYVDHFDNTVIAYDRTDGWVYAGFNYSISGDKVTIDFESKKRKKCVYEDFIDGEPAQSGFNFNEIIDDYANYLKKEFTVDVKSTQEYVSLVNEHNKLSEQFSIIKNELDAVKARDNLKSKTELYEKFAEHLKDDDVYIDLGTEADGIKKFLKFSIEDLEINLAKLFTAKNIASFNKKEKTGGLPVCGVETFSAAEDESKKPYNKVLEDYKKKNAGSYT